MMMRILTTTAVLAMSVASSTAFAGKYDDGIPVKICVQDEEGEPISTAVIRHPEESDRHRVNTTTGCWEESVLYMPDGSELKFEKGTELQFEISAPNYSNENITYTVRKRKNIIRVTLAELNLDFGEIEENEPMIQFGRDKPIDGAQ